MPEEERLSRIEQQLEDLQELVEENNGLLRQTRSAARWSLGLRIAVWAVILVLPFLLIGPILRAIVPAGATGTGAFGMPSAEQLQDALNTYRDLEFVP
jgi:hypothetical protein